MILNEDKYTSVNVDVHCRMNCSALFIGDICYALDEKIYNMWLNRKRLWGTFRYNNDICALVAGTRYGDGEYFDYKGNVFPVDAGLIGITNLKYGKSDNDLDDLGLIIRPHNGVCWIDFNRDDDGNFSIFIRDDKKVLYNDCIRTGDAARPEDEEWEDFEDEPEPEDDEFDVYAYD